MNNEYKLIIELWEYFRDQLVASKRLDAAIQLLKLFEEYGADISNPEIQGECEYLDEAVSMLTDDHDNDHDYDHEEDD